MLIAKIIIQLFGLFLIASGGLMAIAPERARRIIGSAGSTVLINYSEITLRLIPATALIFVAPISKFPLAFWVFGWIMLITSIMLYFVPRAWHYAYAKKAAALLKPLYLRVIAPFSVLLGIGMIYAVM